MRAELSKEKRDLDGVSHLQNLYFVKLLSIKHSTLVPLVETYCNGVEPAFQNPKKLTLMEFILFALEFPRKDLFQEEEMA